MNEILESSKMTGYHMEHMLCIAEVKVRAKRDGVFDTHFTHYSIEVVSAAQAGEEGFVELYQNGEIVSGTVTLVPKEDPFAATNDHLDLHKSAPASDPHAARPKVLAIAPEILDWKPTDPLGPVLDAMKITDDMIKNDWKAGDEWDVMTDEKTVINADSVGIRVDTEPVAFPHIPGSPPPKKVRSKNQTIAERMAFLGLSPGQPAPHIRQSEKRSHRVGCKPAQERMRRAQKAALLAMVYGGNPRNAAMSALEREGHPKRTIHQDASVAAKAAEEIALRTLGIEDFASPRTYEEYFGVPRDSGMDFGRTEAFHAVFCNIPKTGRTSAAKDPEHSTPGGFAAQVTETVVNRGSDYGKPSDNHQTTADIWSAWLSRRLGRTTRITAEDVCLLNSLQKHSRLASSTKDDSLLDIAGYIENVAMLKSHQRNQLINLEMSRK